MTFTEEGNPNFVEDTDIVNLTKFRFITKLLDEISAMQPRGYSYLVDENPKILNIITAKSYRIDSSDQQYDFSLLCEASKRTRKPAISMCDDTLQVKQNIEASRRKSVSDKASKNMEIPALPVVRARTGRNQPDDSSGRDSARSPRRSKTKSLQVPSKRKSKSKSPSTSRHKTKRNRQPTGINGEPTPREGLRQSVPNIAISINVVDDCSAENSPSPRLRVKKRRRIRSQKR